MGYYPLPRNHARAFAQLVQRTDRKLMEVKRRRWAGDVPDPTPPPVDVAPTLTAVAFVDTTHEPEPMPTGE
jgi:hypothetical protein